MPTAEPPAAVEGGASHHTHKQSREASAHDARARDEVHGATRTAAARRCPPSATFPLSGERSHDPLLATRLRAKVPDTPPYWR